MTDLKAPDDSIAVDPNTDMARVHCNCPCMAC